jgi:hypothetical protein
MNETSQDPVAAQLVAYNARALEAFLECYAPDCVVEDGAGKVLMRDRHEMRAHYSALFGAHPALHCEVVHRARVGEWAIDEERITGRGETTLHAVVIYRVLDGRITHVRILR